MASTDNMNRHGELSVKNKFDVLGEESDLIDLNNFMDVSQGGRKRNVEDVGSDEDSIGGRPLGIDIGLLMLIILRN